MHHPTAFVTPVVEHWLEREIAQWVKKQQHTNDYCTNNNKSKSISLSCISISPRYGECTTNSPRILLFVPLLHTNTLKTHTINYCTYNKSKHTNLGCNNVVLFSFLYIENIQQLSQHLTICTVVTYIYVIYINY